MTLELRRFLQVRFLVCYSLFLTHARKIFALFPIAYEMDRFSDTHLLPTHSCHVPFPNLCVSPIIA